MADSLVEQPTGERDEQDEIVSKFLAGVLSTQEAANMLASVTIASNPESGLNVTWAAILPAIRESSDEHQERLVNLLVQMAGLPPARDLDGHQLKVRDMLLWDDLPMFGWEINDEWNHFGPPAKGPERQKLIDEFINVNKCTARLIKTGKPVFADLDIYALWTMRTALETPIAEVNTELDPPEAYIPAVAVWLQILGKEIYSWDKEFAYDPPTIGDRGRGGPLWSGQHGFCKERWHLWRRRFAKLSSSVELTEELKEVCKEAHMRMSEIEAQSA